MSKYSWSQYNRLNIKLSKKLIKFNEEKKINYRESGLYNHIRDIFCVALLINRKNNKINVLDYGSNVASLSNIKSKINTNSFNFHIYDPFLKNNKTFYKPLKIKLLKKSQDLKKIKFEFVNFGSSIQYINNLEEIRKIINFFFVKTISITHTPITFLKKYKSYQTNHPNLIQIVYSYKEIIKFFSKEGFKVIFKSRNNDKHIACKSKRNKTFSLNLIFTKK